MDIPVRKELERLSRSRVWRSGWRNVSNCLAGRRGSGQSGDRCQVGHHSSKGRIAIVSLKMASGESNASRSGQDSLKCRKRADREEDGRREASERHALEPVLDGQGESTVGRIWRAHGLKPHLARTLRQTICREVGGCGPIEHWLDGFDRALRRDADRGPDCEPG